ncbi:MAG: hypothetical protein AAB353_03605 [Candidatus Hydrogenedentota bacterium]
MEHTGNDLIRILSIDLCNRGVGFVVLESPYKLVDWGVKQAARRVDDQEISRAEELIRHYRPHVVTVEDVDHPMCRRGPRARRITKLIEELALKRDTRVYRCDPHKLNEAFADMGARTKRQVAAAVALRLPPLIRHLPPVRKPWMSEDPRTSIFDAASYAMTFLRERSRDVASN